MIFYTFFSFDTKQDIIFQILKELEQSDLQMDSLVDQFDRSVDIPSASGENNLIDEDSLDVRTIPGVGSPIPNSNRDGAYSGLNVGVNVNASPSKRNNYNNLVNFADLGINFAQNYKNNYKNVKKIVYSIFFIGECSSSNNSPMHYASVMNRNAKANNIANSPHPIRPSRLKKPVSPPSDTTGINFYYRKISYMYFVYIIIIVFRFRFC